MSEEKQNAFVKLQGYAVYAKGSRLQSFILEQALAELNDAFLLPKRLNEKELKKKREATLKECGILEDAIPLPENTEPIRLKIKNLIENIEKFCEEQSVTPDDVTFSISSEPGLEGVYWEFSGYSDHSAEELAKRVEAQANETHGPFPHDGMEPAESEGADAVPDDLNGTLLTGNPTDLLALHASPEPLNPEEGELRYLSLEDVVSQMRTLFLPTSIQEEPNAAIRQLNEKYQPFLSGDPAELHLVVSVLVAAVDVGNYIRFRDDASDSDMTYEDLRLFLNNASGEPPSNIIGEFLVDLSDEYPDEGKDAMLEIGNLIHYFNELHALKIRGTALSPATKNVLLWAEYLAALEKLVAGK